MQVSEESSFVTGVVSVTTKLDFRSVKSFPTGQSSSTVEISPDLFGFSKQCLAIPRSSNAT